MSERKRQRKAVRKSGRTSAIPNQQSVSYPSQYQADLELEGASPFRPNARPHERYDADLTMEAKPTGLWDDVEAEPTKPRSLAVHVGHDSESSSQNSSTTNALTSGSSAHASAVEPITPSSDVPYGSNLHVQGVGIGLSSDSPHLTRLLQGLSLSAAAVEPPQILANNTDSKMSITTPVLSAGTQSDDQKRPPPTKSIFDFVSPFDALASPASKPEPISTPTLPLPPIASQTKRANPSSNRHTPVTSTPPAGPHSKAPAPPTAFADLGLVPASLTSKSPILHKRVAATPQPYTLSSGLPQPAATPIPADSGTYPVDRHRKQLALLESIAGDADRLMTPAQTPLMSSRTPAAQFLNYLPGNFQVTPDRQQYHVGIATGAPRPVLPPSPLYSRPTQPRMAGPEPNVHKGHLLTMLSNPTPSATPMPLPGPPNIQPYPQAMYHNTIPHPHPQFGPNPTPAPMSGSYGAPTFPMQPQYAPPAPNQLNGGFPSGASLLSIFNTNNSSAHPQGHPYPTPGLS